MIFYTKYVFFREFRVLGVLSGFSNSLSIIFHKLKIRLYLLIIIIFYCQGSITALCVRTPRCHSRVTIWIWNGIPSVIFMAGIPSFKAQNQVNNLIFKLLLAHELGSYIYTGIEAVQ